MLHESEIRHLRDAWITEEPPAGLADRIVAHATAQPQARPWRLRLRLRALLAGRGTQRHIAFSGLALAACLMLAVVALDNPGKPAASANATAGKAKAHNTPMEQIVEELLWSEYYY